MAVEDATNYEQLMNTTERHEKYLYEKPHKLVEAETRKKFRQSPFLPLTTLTKSNDSMEKLKDVAKRFKNSSKSREN